MWLTEPVMAVENVDQSISSGEESFDEKDNPEGESA